MPKKAAKLAILSNRKSGRRKAAMPGSQVTLGGQSLGLDDKQLDTLLHRMNRRSQTKRSAKNIERSIGPLDVVSAHESMQIIMGLVACSHRLAGSAELCRDGKMKGPLSV